MYTDKLFTGQREMAGLGIYHYQSRFYSPKLGRFLSADSIVPGMANPQNLNRFSYVGNNPIRYTDPTGYCRIDAVPEDCLKADKSNAPKKPYLPPPCTRNCNGGGTPPVTNNPPAINNPTPSITPTPPNVVLPAATPNSTPNPFAEDPTFVATQTPACPESYAAQGRCPVNNLGYQPSPTLGWDSSLVPWDEVALDAAGLLGDLVPIYFQLPATAAEGVKNYNNALNVAEFWLDAWDIKQSDSIEEIDGINVMLDFASFVPEFGAVPSAIGLIYNLKKGIVINEYRP